MADTGPDALVITPDMRARKGRMDLAADGFLALPGGLGTLEELLEVWVARSLLLHDKPVVVLDPHGVLAGLRTLADRLAAQGFVRPAALEAVLWTTTVEDALDALEAGVQAPDGRPAPLPEELLEAEP